jgi:hypothetical protein
VGSGRRGTNSKAACSDNSPDATVGDDETRRDDRQTTDDDENVRREKSRRTQFAKSLVGAAIVVALGGCASPDQQRDAFARYSLERADGYRQQITVVAMPEQRVTCFVFAPPATYAPAISCVRDEVAP